MQAIRTIDRIDDVRPTFAGVSNGVTYDVGVTITFNDDHPGVTATMNGSPFTN
jgi:hypothetical protein